MLPLVVGNKIISDIGRCALLCTAKKKANNHALYLFQSIFRLWLDSNHREIKRSCNISDDLFIICVRGLCRQGAIRHDCRNRIGCGGDEVRPPGSERLYTTGTCLWHVPTAIRGVSGGLPWGHPEVTTIVFNENSPHQGPFPSLDLSSRRFNLSRG